MLEGGAISIVEMYYTTNLVAVVGKNEKADFTPHRLSIWDTQSSQCQMEITFTSLIEFVKLNKERYV